MNSPKQSKSKPMSDAGIDVSYAISYSKDEHRITITIQLPPVWVAPLMLRTAECCASSVIDTLQQLSTLRVSLKPND